MSSQIRIVGFTGSLREESYNKAALHIAQEHLPANSELEIISLANLPTFEEHADIPESVYQFREKLRQADAVLIVTPEYKGRIARTLKNALLWAGEETMAHKPTAIMGFGRVSDGGEQPYLRMLLYIVRAATLDDPVLYMNARAISQDQEFITEDIRTRISDLLTMLVARAKMSTSTLVNAMGTL